MALGLIGCTSSNSAPFQPVLSVAGEWQFSTTLTTVTPGTTVPPFPIPAVGSTTTGRLILTQAVTTVSGSGTNQSTGTTFPLTGEVQGQAVTLASRDTNANCGPVRVDLSLQLNESGTQMTGTAVSQVGSCFSSTGTLTANRVL
ncbi:MAG: hypothetical protein OHK0012_18010 [Synechococcales cyanobacterium]